MGTAHPTNLKLMNWNRLVSLIVAIGYLSLAIISGMHDGRIIPIFAYLIICLGCIWFGDEIGSFVGIGSKGIFISSPTPGVFMQIMGWLLLIIPIAVPLIMELPNLER